MQSLDNAVVDWQDAVVEEAREGDAVVLGVLDRFAEERGRRLAGLVGLAPDEEFVVDRLGPSLALGEAPRSVEIPRRILDVVEGLERGERDCRAHVTGFERLHEISTRVHVAPYFDSRAVLKAPVKEARSVGDDWSFA